MTTKIRPEHASMLQMNDWLAEFRDGESAEPAGPGDAEPAGPGDAEPAGPGDAEPAGPGDAQPAGPGNDRRTGPGPSGPGYAVPASYAVPTRPGHAVPASYAVPTRPGHAVPASYVHAVSGGPGYAVPAGPGGVRPEALARPVAAAGPAATAAPASTATPAAPPGPAAPAAPASPAGTTARAVIGEQLRMPIMWCEMGCCISWHTDPAALGEADTRARAIAAGWRVDALGRLACPRCQQTDPGYWAAGRVVPWDRSTAIARTVPIPAVPGNGGAGRATRGTSRDPGHSASDYPQVSRTERESHHDLPADEAMPAGRYSADPAGTSRSRLAALNAVRAWRARGGRQATTSASQ